MKAWGGRLPWKGIEVLSGSRGKPFIVFEDREYTGVSISHERLLAVSVVEI